MPAGSWLIAGKHGRQLTGCRPDFLAIQDLEDSAAMIACLRTWGLHGSLKTAQFVVLGIAAAGPFGPLATAQSTANPATAANTYKANCAICHGDDGSGTALGNRLHVKDLRAREVQEKSTKALAQIIGAGKGSMPAFGTRLDSEQIQKLVEYVRHNKAKPVS
jgi:mono/diheme cytochrome c family protein